MRLAPPVRLLLAAFLLFGALPVAAQTGAVVGTVSDATDNLPLPGAAVVALGASGEMLAGNATDPNGRFELLGLPTGRITLRVSYLGYTAADQTVTVVGGQTETIRFALAPRVLGSGEAVVLGQALRGQARALNQQQNAATLTNVVSADQIGRFPDGNAGDALKRIPGVVVQNDQGEARFGLIRGTTSAYNSITINGERQPSSEADTRALSLDLIPADLLQAIEVNKTLTPDQDADAIGGSVNLVTRAAPAGLRVSSTLGSGLNLLSNQPTTIASVVLGDRLAGGRLGALVSASYFNHPLGSDNVEFEWDTDDAGADVLVDHQVRKYEVQRIRTGLTTSFDYRLGQGSEIFLRSIYNLRDDYENRYRLRFRLDRTDPTPDASGVVSGVRVERQLKGGGPDQREARLERSVTTSHQLAGRHLLGGLVQVDWAGTVAYARESRPNERYATFRTNGVTVQTNLADRDEVLVGFAGGEPSATAYELNEFSIENGFTDEFDVNGRLDVSLPITRTGRFANRAQAGLRLRTKAKTRDNDFFVYEPTEDFLLSDFDPEDETDDGYLAGPYAAGLFPTTASLARMEALVPADRLEAFEEYIGGNFQADERILAGYGMLTQNLGPGLSAVGGLRVEQTSLDYTGNEVLFDEDGDFESATPRSETSSYVTVLPSLNVRAELAPNTVGRFAVGRSLARPNYFELTPYRIILREDNELEEGNPALDPTTSWNVDASAERYFESVGILSAGAFFKSIDSFIYSFSQDDYADPRSGATFDQYTQPRNGNGATLVGVELAAQRQLDFLPGGLRGLGVYLNYTFTDSEVDPLPERDADIPELPGTSRHSVNASLSYELRGVSARLSLNHHSAHIDEVGSAPENDIYYAAATHVDLNGSVALPNGFRIFAEANNLTNQPLRFYQGTSDRFIQREYYNARFNLGLKYDL